MKTHDCPICNSRFTRTNFLPWCSSPCRAAGTQIWSLQEQLENLQEECDELREENKVLKRLVKEA